MQEEIKQQQQQQEDNIRMLTHKCGLESVGCTQTLLGREIVSIKEEKKTQDFP